MVIKTALQKVKWLIQVRNWNGGGKVLNPCPFRKFVINLPSNEFLKNVIPINPSCAPALSNT